MTEETKLTRLDLGCGTHKCSPDWTGVDCRQFDGVDVVADLTKPWPWEDGTVDEIHASHFLEHLDGPERVHFANEAYRVLKPGAKCVIVCPHWASCRAYGDVTHKWPPVSEFWPFYLDREWRAVNAPHNDGYTCDFTHGSGPGLEAQILTRNQEFQQFAARYFKEACQDIHIHLTKRA